MRRFDRIKAEIERRYKRATTSNHKPHVAHYGNCDILKPATGICTCGLINMLRNLSFDEAKKIYPNFEEDFKKHSERLDDLEYAYLQRD
ncbi:hypothetical protein LCGC14_1732090 [marine sediment metagenome]|uniref:Uncharacterized protein n=1 Tax=marine sediment metagenome TaxID=412755 RepID=A0A0F9K8Y0_9ZZZZ